MTPQQDPGATILPPSAGFLNPKPDGLKDSSDAPQVPGKLLLDKDINEALVGRHAELFWPDDSSWYLIEIQVR